MRISRRLDGRPQLPPTLLFFPVSNISGIYTTLPALLNGHCAVLLERFTVAGWHDYVLRYRPTAGGLPPAGVQMVLSILGHADTSVAFQRTLMNRVGEWESYSDSHNGQWGPAAMVEALAAYGVKGYQIHALATRAAPPVAATSACIGDRPALTISSISRCSL